MQDNKYYELINSTPVEAVPARLFDLCKQATVVKEFVVGVAGCCLAWKTRVNPAFIVRAMADAYVQRVVPPPGKLGILYIFNDIVQKDPGAFAAVGQRHFLRLIAPIVAYLPEPVQQAHVRVLAVLEERRVYSKQQVTQVRRAFNVHAAEQRRALLDALALEEDATAAHFRQVFNIADPVEQGRRAATLKATALLTAEPRTAEPAAHWANVLLQAAGLRPDSPPDAFKNLDKDSTASLVDALQRTIDFTKLELEIIQHLLIDWSVAVDHDNARCQLLMDVLAEDAPQQDAQETT